VQGAPRLTGELAARRLGADPALLAAQLRERAQEARGQTTPRGLRLDQAAAVWHVLTSSRTVEVITGPAGTGKTRVLAATARAWAQPDGTGRVFGTATYQNATNELRPARRPGHARLGDHGPRPAARRSGARREWEHKAAAIAAYREMFGYEHPDDPIGPEPCQEVPAQRAVAARRAQQGDRPGLGQGRAGRGDAGQQ
jgi:AAA domain